MNLFQVEPNGFLHSLTPAALEQELDEAVNEFPVC